MLPNPTYAFVISKHECMEGKQILEKFVLRSLETQLKLFFFFFIYDFTLKIFNAWGEHLYNAFMIFWDYCSWISYPLENSL